MVHAGRREERVGGTVVFHMGEATVLAADATLPGAWLEALEIDQTSTVNA
jgi:hypothetical protein